MAARAADELLPRYANYALNRLLTVSAEDCADMVTAEVLALHDAWAKVRKDASPTSRASRTGHRIFLLKAIVLLAKCRHSRDADELGLLIVDRMSEDQLDAALADVDSQLSGDADWEFPEYAFDVHTKRGRKAGKTRAQFIREEHDALSNSTSMFANFDEMAASAEYVQPELP
jgi:hypothetical protein